tara:strand:- start:199 stop:873 length:675 start_codon:yes stop_codon:yes gene_type:complete
MNAIKDMLRDGGQWKYELDWDGVKNMEVTFQTFFKKYKTTAYRILKCVNADNIKHVRVHVLGVDTYFSVEDRRFVMSTISDIRKCGWNPYVTVSEINIETNKTFTIDMFGGMYRLIGHYFNLKVTKPKQRKFTVEYAMDKILASDGQLQIRVPSHKKAVSIIFRILDRYKISDSVSQQKYGRCISKTYYSRNDITVNYTNNIMDIKIETKEFLLKRKLNNFLLD